METCESPDENMETTDSTIIRAFTLDGFDGMCETRSTITPDTSAAYFCIQMTPSLSNNLRSSSSSSRPCAGSWSKCSRRRLRTSASDSPALTSILARDKRCLRWSSSQDRYSRMNSDLPTPAAPTTSQNPTRFKASCSWCCSFGRQSRMCHSGSGIFFGTSAIGRMSCRAEVNEEYCRTPGTTRRRFRTSCAVREYRLGSEAGAELKRDRATSRRSNGSCAADATRLRHRKPPQTVK